jgi:hypothetical protein
VGVRRSVIERHRTVARPDVDARRAGHGPLSSKANHAAEIQVRRADGNRRALIRLPPRCTEMSAELTSIN